MAYPAYRAAGIITGTEWDNFVTTVLDYDGSTAVVGFNANLDGRENYWYCDGVADDVQIQLAIDYAIAGAGRVFVESGNYNITSQLNVVTATAGFMLVGEGPGTNLISALGAGVNVIDVPVRVAGRSNIEFRTFRITGNGTEQHGLAVNDLVRTGLIRDVIVSGVGGDGIHTEGCFELRIEGCQLRDNNRGIFIGASATRGSHVIKITANTFWDQIGHDIVVQDDPNSVIISFNSSTDAGGDFVDCVEASFIRIINNYVENPGGDGIHLGSHGANSTVSPYVLFNEIDAAGADGIRIDRTTTAYVMFNRVGAAAVNNVEVTANATSAFVINAGAIVDAGTTTAHFRPNAGMYLMVIGQGFGFPVHTDITRPAPATAGLTIWNSGDNMLNIADGVNWRDTNGAIT